ncbi:MAG: hypothetical protein JJU11_17120, partial [Candidatus Sumerlaeia bacterium]|nr:hypothetical protein [Candidatus Sumerlaeia bacterium]
SSARVSPDHSATFGAGVNAGPAQADPDATTSIRITTPENHRIRAPPLSVKISHPGRLEEPS